MYFTNARAAICFLTIRRRQWGRSYGRDFQEFQMGYPRRYERNDLFPRIFLTRDAYRCQDQDPVVEFVASTVRALGTDVDSLCPSCSGSPAFASRSTRCQASNRLYSDKAGKETWLGKNREAF